MTWQVFFWTDREDSSAVQRWLDGLSKAMLKSIAKELELLRLAGNQLKLPHSRALGDGLFELREREYGLRVYYTFRGQQVIVLLAAGKKDTQERDIKVARKNLKLLRSGEHIVQVYA